MNKRDEYAVKNENLIGTEGGTYVNGDVIPDGDFVGRDKTIINNYLFKFSSRVVGYAMSIIIVVGLTIYWVWLPSLNTPKLIQAVSQNQSISQFEQDLVVTSSLDTEKIWLSSFPILPDRKRIVSSGATGPADFDRIVYDNFEGLVNFTVHNIGESTLLIDAVQLEVINISPMKFNAVEIPTRACYALPEP